MLALKVQISLPPRPVLPPLLLTTKQRFILLASLAYLASSAVIAQSPPPSNEQAIMSDNHLDSAPHASPKYRVRCPTDGGFPFIECHNHCRCDDRSLSCDNSAPAACRDGKDGGDSCGCSLA